MYSVQREDNAVRFKNHVNIKLEKSQNAQQRNQSADGLQKLEFATIVSGKLFQDVTRRSESSRSAAKELNTLKSKRNALSRRLDVQKDSNTAKRQRDVSNQSQNALKHLLGMQS